jgi:tetratricopeptide (TPR) repeat protein
MAAATGPRAASAQQMDVAAARGMELEQAGKSREAVAAYREALRGRDPVPGVLGLERVYTELGWGDTLRVLVDSVVRASPGNPTLRAVQLRVLRAAGHEGDARAAFEGWVREAPGDAAPYREYARQLIAAGDAAAADTVIQRATKAFGARGAREFALEIAQSRSALGLWEPASRSWREALAEAPYLAQAAVFALQPAPAAARPGIRVALGAPPVALAPRQALASLELAWGSPRGAWDALRQVPPSDSAAAAWREFAELAEASGSWGVAREALLAAHAAHADPALLARAAAAALSGGDAAGALDLAARAPADSATARALLPVRVRALAALGRPGEAEVLVQGVAAGADDSDRAQLRRDVAWGWVRAGDVGRARAALASAGAGEDEDAEGWLALYEGDLATARAKLARSREASWALVTARALLARSRSDRAPAAGGAFLLLARGDTARAAAKFAEAGKELPDAAPLLIAVAARLHAARNDDAGAIPLWERIVAQHASAPEAAEADLEWGRALERRGATADAAQRFEHLILAYPESALVPQARRELERTKNPGSS